MKNEKNLTATLQKSYYGKAKTRIENGGIVLRSYDTDVAMIDGNGNFHRLWNGYSRTTMNHVNDFRREHGLEMLNKKAWDNIPCENLETVYNVYISTGFVTHKCPARLTREECEKEVERIQSNNGRVVCWYETAV